VHTSDAEVAARYAARITKNAAGLIADLEPRGQQLLVRCAKQPQRLFRALLRLPPDPGTSKATMQAEKIMELLGTPPVPADSWGNPPGSRVAHGGACWCMDS